MIVFFTTLLILLCLAIVLLILVQRTSGGMGSALGGGTADQYLGAGSAAQLSKLTVWGILFFFLLSFGLYALYQSEADASNELLRSGNVLPSAAPESPIVPELNIGDIENLPEESPDSVKVNADEDLPVDLISEETNPSGNSTK